MGVVPIGIFLSACPLPVGSLANLGRAAASARRPVAITPHDRCRSIVRSEKNISLRPKTSDARTRCATGERQRRARELREVWPW
jgi:hypothetical protein